MVTHRDAHPLSRPGDWPRRWLATVLSHEPQDIELYRAALTHRSASSRNNERLEFLGDAVLNLLAGELLYERFPLAPEGDLSRLRAGLVSEAPLAKIALQLGLGGQLQLGSGEMKTGGFRRESILADGLEALIGAVYLDLGIEVARVWVRGLLQAPLTELPGIDSLKDPKTRLQEYLQARAMPLPRYSVEQVQGEAHAQHFAVRCELISLALVTFGEGSSRRRAEQRAAADMLQRLVQPEVPAASDVQGVQTA
jgi:ribonuclease-3